MSTQSNRFPTRSFRSATRRRALSLEALESRIALSVSVSISDATAVEGSSAMKLIDTFVAPQSGGLRNARGVDYGPDGNLYISGESDFGDPNAIGYVNRYDAASGRFIDRFASEPTLIGAKDVEFGPDGNLYVPNNFGDNVYRFNGTTGEFLDVFVETGSGGIDTPRSLTFGPDGNGDGNPDAYVTSAQTDNVLRYDGITGAFIDAFVPSGSGGLNDPTAIVFGPDSNLYVASGAHSNFYNSILRYNGTTGAFIDVFVPAGSGGLTLAPTAGFIFGPDVNADGTPELYVSNGELDEVLIYSGDNGAFLQKYIPPGLGGLIDPKGLLFDTDGNLLVISNYDSVLRFGHSSWAALTVSLSAASESTVAVEFSTSNGSAQAGIDYVATTGTLTFAPGQKSRMIIVQTVDDAIAEPNETFSVVLSNPQGAVLADGTGVATILDNDSTKFYVVNDATQNQTYEYDAGGVVVDSYSLSSSDSAPRGAASTAAGDKVWVVDANKTVYVYNAGGTLLGSWSAGSLNGAAQVEGVATNGTDVWLVDGKQAKVFRYTNAAGRLSGSQNSARSFSLDKSNKSPKDIVTDGTYLWVVDDSSADKVFKYTLSGSLVGSWTISTSGATSPTGITLDLANNSDLWIVDSVTDRVHQYTAAASRTSGSQSAAASFPLAPDNTNPQGIADPPTGAIGSFSYVTPTPTKQLATTAALARTAATPGAIARPPYKAATTRPAFFTAPVLPAQYLPEAVDTAVTDLFNADGMPFARRAVHTPLSIDSLVADLAAAMR